METDMTWRTLRKTGILLHVGYGDTFSNNLYAHDSKVRTDPEFEISLDLNGDLRTRNKAENSYQDARELADGEIEHLQVLQITDHTTINRLAKFLDSLDDPPSEWILTIELEGRHSFRVRPDFRETGDLPDLFLNVISANEASSSL